VIHSDQPGRIVSISSDDGLVTFSLEPCFGGVMMERKRRQTTAGSLTQAVRFRAEADFIRWCDCDRLRFAYPLLFANLRRSASALFNSHD
jgi:hypothetical protein